MKKGRHRRFEEARALKRSHDVDLNDLFDSISDAPEGEHKPEHDAWADLAEEWGTSESDADGSTDADSDESAESDAGTVADADDQSDLAETDEGSR